MISTIQCPLLLDPSLVGTIETFNEAVQVVIDAGWDVRTCNKNRLHVLTYITIRDNLPSLQSVKWPSFQPFPNRPT